MSDLDTLRRHCSHYLLGRVFLLALGFVSFFAPSLKRILILASLLIVIRSQWSILSGFLQAEGRTRVYNVLDVINKAGSIAVICLLLITWPRSLAAFFTGTIVVEAAAA